MFNTREYSVERELPEPDRMLGARALTSAGMKPLSCDAHGANLIEYALLLGCVALLAIAGFRFFGGTLKAKVIREADCIAVLGVCPENAAAGSHRSGSLRPTSSSGRSVASRGVTGPTAQKGIASAARRALAALPLTETKLAGTYGEYTIRHGFVDADDGWYAVEISMKPNDKAKADRIGWVQVVRRSKDGGAGSGWGTSLNDPAMTVERVKRTDPSTGWRVDRETSDLKTPFMGMTKRPDGKLRVSNSAAIGKHGVDDAYMWDGPSARSGPVAGPNDKGQLQFLSTATDMDTGVQYDAIAWGYTYDRKGRIATEETPTIVKAGDERMAGRDIAINKWNTDVAGVAGVDQVPTTVDPAAIAKTAQGAIEGLVTNKNALQRSLKPITDADVKNRVKAAYKLLTGRELANDLRRNLSGTELKKFEAWL